jgi:hypothetical protein
MVERQIHERGHRQRPAFTNQITQRLRALQSEI